MQHFPRIERRNAEPNGGPAAPGRPPRPCSIAKTTRSTARATGSRTSPPAGSPFGKGHEVEEVEDPPVSLSRRQPSDAANHRRHCEHSGPFAAPLRRTEFPERWKEQRER